MIENPIYQEFIDIEMQTKFEEYLTKDWKYFGYDTYFNKEVETLFSVMSDFSTIIFKLHFKLKKSVLEFQAGMLNNLFS